MNMSRKKGQTYSAEQKTKIVLELLKEEQTIAQIASKYQITSQSITKRKKGKKKKKRGRS